MDGPMPPCATRPARVELDGDVFEALVDEAIEVAVAHLCLPAAEPCAAAPRAPVDPSVMEALLDEILEEIAGHGGAARPAPCRAACAASLEPCAG